MNSGPGSRYPRPVRKIEPYKTISGAMRSLDNGGRFYNLFTAADDQQITAAELKKAAGILGGSQTAALFLALATSDLKDTEQSRIRSALGPKARKWFDRYQPESLTPRDFAAKAKAGNCYVVEGEVRLFDDVEVTGMIFIPIQTGKVTSLMPVPTTDYYTVYELGKAKRGSECLVLAPKQATQFEGTIRFAGVAKEAEVEGSRGTVKRLRLEPQFYAVI